MSGYERFDQTFKMWNSDALKPNRVKNYKCGFGFLAPQTRKILWVRVKRISTKELAQLRRVLVAVANDGFDAGPWV